MAKIYSMKKQKSELSQKDKVKINPWKKGAKEPSNELASANQGQVTIHFKSVSWVDGALSVSFSISNGHNRKVKFKKVPLLLIDSNKRVLARQSFDGDSIGEIGRGISKDCVALFTPDNVHVQEVPKNCKLCFDVPDKRSQTPKIQYQALPERTTEAQKQELERILANLPPMKPGEVSFSPLHAKVTTNNDFLATVIVRNFANKKINIEQVPLILFDAHREELARGQFEVKGLTIESFKAVLLTLNFGPAPQEREIDLSSWSVNVIK